MDYTALCVGGDSCNEPDRLINPIILTNLMMRIFRIWTASVFAAVALAFTGCSEPSDPETEQALQGTWMVELTDSKEVPEGVESYVVEMYDLFDHRFEGAICVETVNPVNERVVTVTYSGTWKASKKAIYHDIDKNSIEFKFNRNILDNKECEEFKLEILEEFKKEGNFDVRIVSPITETFEAIDDEGTHVTYTMYPYCLYK